MKKYELTDKTKQVGEATIHRIRALRDFGDIKKGDIGGWIEKESNLSHEGDCWVSGNALVYGSALISGSAQIYGRARVSGEARVFGRAQVTGEAQIYGRAEIYN